MMLSTSQKITFAVLMGILAVIVGWDIFAVCYWGDSAGATESWVIFTLSRNYPIIPFLFGMLMGHLFASLPGIVIESAVGSKVTMTSRTIL